MAIDKLGSAAPGSPVREGVRESFNKLLETAPRKVMEPAPTPVNPVVAPRPCQVRATAGTSRVGIIHHVEGVPGMDARQLARAVEQVKAAQDRLDHVLQLARAGRTFTQTELLALQAQVYSASQQLDLAGKAVEKATAGVKQILQTQV